MLGNTYPGQDCSAARTLELVGERWTLLILRDALFRHYVRYSQFSASLGIATNILAKRLEGLVAAGIMDARSTGGHADHREYHLTERGQEMKPIIMALTEWGDKWLGPGPVLFHDQADGSPVAVRICRLPDGLAVTPSDVIARRRPPVQS